MFRSALSARADDKPAFDRKPPPRFLSGKNLMPVKVERPITGSGPFHGPFHQPADETVPPEIERTA
jgi:hypothetical protein